MRFRRSRWPDYGQNIPGGVCGLAWGGVLSILLSIPVGAVCHARFRRSRQPTKATGSLLLTRLGTLGLGLSGFGVASLGLTGVLVSRSRGARIRQRDDRNGL